MDRFLIWYSVCALLVLVFGFALSELLVCPASEQLSTVIDVSFC